MGNRFVGSGRPLEGGVMAVRKSDFNTHTSGGDFRHTADQIDLKSTIVGVNGSTVQQALSSLNSIISSGGTGFISIGNADGYAQGVYNINSNSTPTLNEAFTAAVANPRLANGGVILLLAGTYTITSPITIPAGISVIGEIEGTLIIGEMAEQPMFIISKTAKNYINIGGNSGSGNIGLDTGSNVDSVRFYNFMLSDNLNNTVASGGSSMSTVPMIQCQISSNFSCERVSFLGKINSGAINGRSKTLSAIGYITGGSTGTILNLKECFFDGLKIGVNFSPNNGNVDFLTVDGCKARTYGTEDSSVPSQALNSFIVSSLCNANLINNYFVGAGSQVKTFWDITLAGGVTSVVTKVIGNTGTPNNNVGDLIHNATGVTFTSITTGNNWGIAVDSPWTIVVGGADGDTPLGDIFGPNAINTVISLAASSQDFQATIIVNPGIYTVTGNASTVNNANINFIGNKKGKKYPVFQLNLSYGGALDAQGNRYIGLGNNIESIQFNSITRSQTVIAYTDLFSTVANTTRIIDCIFDNTCLGIQNVPSSGTSLSDNLSLEARWNIEVEHCNFLQTGLFNDKVSCFLPNAYNISVSKCNFYGSGYALSIGAAGYSTSFSLSDCFINIEDCCLNLNGSNITIASALGSSFSNYIYINSSAAMVAMENCQVYVDASFDPASSPIVPTLQAVGYFDAFIKIIATDITIDNCLINGPADVTFSSAAVDYTLPSMVLTPKRSGRVSNCKFINSCFPLQFTGSSLFGDTTNRDGIYINNCLFTTEGVSRGQTCLDIDANIFSGSTPHIVITNNTFKSTSVTGSVTPIKHYNFTGANYVQNGIVQIWADKCFVNFSGNNIVGNLFPASAGGYTDYSCLVINGFETTSDSGTIPTSIQISNNSIVGLNNYATATAAHSASNLWLKGIASMVNDNYFQMANQIALNSSFIGNLKIDSRATSTGTYSDTIVSGNIFSRRTQTGATSNLVGGYVKIPSTSKSGKLFNNSFSDATIDGSSTVTVLDQTSEPNKWAVYNNRNQTISINLQSSSGRLANASSGSSLVVAGTYPTNLVIASFDLEPPSYTFSLNYTASSSATFDWHLPLQSLLPNGVRVISVTISGTSSVDFTTGTLAFSLQGVGLTSATGTPTLNFTTGAGSIITSVITPSNSSSTTTFNNTPENGLKIILTSLTGNLQHSAGSIIQLTAITVVYRWI